MPMAGHTRWDHGVEGVIFKGALLSACAMGLIASYKLLVIFQAALQPFVLAAMFVGCIEWFVERTQQTLGFFIGGIISVGRAMVRCCRRSREDIARPASTGDLATPIMAGTDAEEPLGLSFVPVPTYIKEKKSFEYFAAWVNRVRPDKVYGRIMQRVNRSVPADIKRWTTLDPPGESSFLRIVSIVLTLVLSGLWCGLFCNHVIGSITQTSFDPYVKGFRDLEEGLLQVAKQFSNTSYVAEHLKTVDINSKAGELMSAGSSVVNSLLEASSGFLMAMTFFLLYAFMWLLQPMAGNKNIFLIVRTYFMLKTACNGVYAVMCYVLMRTLNIDLAIVIGLLSFVLAYIPEVGAFIAVVLPVPLALLDGRHPINERLWTLLWAVGGMIGIKFVCANGLESVVMGRNRTLAGVVDKEEKEYAETHPVIVLFAVVIFGNIWGPTGMLISVPLISLVRYYVARELKANPDDGQGKVE